MTPFLYLLEARELMCDLLDALCGARVTTTTFVLAGSRPTCPRLRSLCVERLDRSLVLLGDAITAHTKPVFRDRVEGTGHLPPEH